MSMVTYPLNNIEYTAEDAELFHSTRTSGVYSNNSFDYSLNSADNTIVIGTGIAWIKNSEFSGKVAAQKEAVSLNMGIPDANYPRIDAIVIQFDANKNSTEIIIKNGTAQSNPTAPAVIRTRSVYELHLYHVKRNAGSLTVSADNVTDLRTDSKYCGLMSDSITQAVDTTLSKHGVAADAAATGAALKGKAPAGYGLGLEDSPEITDANLAVANGWYRFPQNVVNTPTGFTHGWAFVESYNSTYKKQTYVHDFYRGITAVRFMNNGTWQEWEWVNPPMKLGVEYRTTERYDGKAVYKKKVSVGALPNATVKTFTNLISGYTGIVDFLLTGYSSGAILHPTDPYYFNTTYAGITLNATSDLSPCSGIAYLAYIKD